MGISLSGGFDSSALLTGLSLNKYLNKNVKSFSVDFAPYFSEKYWIKIATEHHGINAFLNSFKPKNFLDSLKPMMWHLEGPIGGLMNCALSVVMSKAKENNITVLLGGMGLDEVFAGYRNMHNIYIRELINNNSPKAQKALADYSNVNLIDKNLAKEQILKQKLGGISTIDGTNPINNKVLSDSVINYVSDINSTNTHYSDIHNMMINYLQESKIPRNMRMMDRLSMAYSLEFRSPFLDHNFVELGLNIHPDFYFLDGYTKSIMRYALQDLMPNNLCFAKKRNIQTPQVDWLKTEPLKSFIKDLILDERFASRGFFKIDEVKNTFKDFCNSKYNNSFFVWQWINLELWHRIFIDETIEYNECYFPF